MRPVLLDLFCGAGGAAMGYYRAGFDVVGVDAVAQPNYPFDFVLADAMTYPLDGFDAVHASPPCQGYVSPHFRSTPSGHVRADHPLLIAAVRDRLRAAGVPYVIENVGGARADMVNPYRLCGSSFGLAVRRHRYFETPFALLVPPCAHDNRAPFQYPTQYRPRTERHSRQSRVVQVYGNSKGAALWPAAMGVDWMSTAELRQAVPPAYTEHIGRQLLDHVAAGA